MKKKIRDYMKFVYLTMVGSCCYLLKSPYCCHLNLITSTSCYSSWPCSSHSTIIIMCSLQARNGGKITKRITCLQNQGQIKDDGISKRKVIIAIFVPLLLQLMIIKTNSSHHTLLAAEEAKMEKTAGMETSQDVAKPNALLSLVNGLGIIGSTVLGSLYASARNEKLANETTIESMRMEINENETSIASLKKNFDLKVQDDREERKKQAIVGTEEKFVLTEKLKMAEILITGIGQELQKEKRMVGDLNVHIQNLQINLKDNKESKKDLEEKLKEKSESIKVLEERIAVLIMEIKEKEVDLHNHSYVVSVKESDLKEMNVSNEHIKYKLAGLNSKARRLNEELLRSERDIDLKNAATESLNSLVSSLLVEREHSIRRIDAILKNNNVRRSSFRERAAADAQLLDEKDREIVKFKEEVDSITRELTRIEALLVDLTQEKDENREVLDSELKIVKNLKQEIEITEGILENSRKEVSNMTDQLHKSENLYSDLEAELSKIQVEFSATKKSLENSIDDVKESSCVLATELKSANEILKKSQEDLKIKSDQLADTVEIRDRLNEIINEYKKIEKRSSKLKEGNDAVESLKKEKRTLEIQILENRESTRFLETDLKEVTRSLDKMNRKAIILTKDTDITNFLASKLELEKEKFFKSLDELREVYRESQENVEDVHRIVIKLGKENENLENRLKKMKEELASAKGEIIRLQIL